MLLMVTDFDPYSDLIQSAFGRLMPIGEDGEQSPARVITLIPLAVTPSTLSFLKRSSIGEFFSNHKAFLLMVAARWVASSSLIDTTDSLYQVDEKGRGSPSRTISLSRQIQIGGVIKCAHI
jgi:hypothetical protein